MAILHGMIHVKSLDKYIDIGPTSDLKFKIKLPSDRRYHIGLDQSTTCSGIYLEDEKNDINMLVDLQRMGEPKELYFQQLISFLDSVVSDLNISLIVYEKPIPNFGQSMSFKILTELKGKIDQWVFMNHNLQNAQVKSIYPQSWKAKIVNKKKGKNRGNNKRFIAEDLCDLKPNLRYYLDKTRAKDYDAFDACSILTGYKLCAFTETGQEKIFGTPEKRHMTTVFYRYVSINDLNTDTRKTLVGFMGPSTTYFNPKFKVYNDDYDRIKNYVVASSNDDFTITMLPSSSLNSLHWKYNFEIDPDKIMLAYIVRKNKFTTTDLNYLKRNMPMWEDIEYVS